MQIMSLSNLENLTKSVEQFLLNTNMDTVRFQEQIASIRNQGLYYIPGGSINYRRIDIT